MEDKLDTIIKNQEIINANLITIYKELLLAEGKLKKSDLKGFLINVASDSLVTIGDKSGLFNTFKK